MPERYEAGMVRYHICGKFCDLSDSDFTIHADSSVIDAILDEELNVAFLPHQCKSWKIGRRAEVETLIADLRALLEKMP